MNGAMLFVIAVLMLGLGFGLTVEDFKRVRRHQMPIAVALLSQLLLLPFVCFGIVTVLDLPPASAVGMMLIAAAPGGPLAGVYSRLFGGDVAFNLTLTAVNSVLSVFTLTVVTNLSLAHFLPGETGIGLQGEEVVRVFAAVLVPIAIGMAVKAKWERGAERAERVFRVVAAVSLLALIAGSIGSNVSALTDNLTTIFPAVLAFALASLTTGYLAGRVTRAGHSTSVAAGFEIGFHNVVVAVTIAMGLTGDFTMAIPAGIYSFTIMIVAALFGLVLNRGVRREPRSEPAPAAAPAAAPTAVG